MLDFFDVDIFSEIIGHSAKPFHVKVTDGEVLVHVLKLGDESSSLRSLHLTYEWLLQTTLIDDSLKSLSLS